ncbi:Trypsin-like peptidase domain-containing protein [Chitinophaga sp. CF118]|uniref:S1 family peptidase n=1 Tax=Chitinophaga sp. CF118 TaxID=1884367 RepID=UPI0008E33B60|nr:serine protease [Chitinophaga sp. CF118]SFD17278.1 Trypsin-like peptidase domain-containing protein [Chitinophaga sp. CF118]
MRFNATIIALLLACNAMCQLKLPDNKLYKSGVVSLNLASANSGGSGFIIGATEDSIYIITARHVVLRAKEHALQITANIGDGNKLPVNILYMKDASDNQLDDIALCSAPLKKVHVGSYCSVSGAEPDTEVFFFRSEAQKERIPVVENGTIESWEDENNRMFSIYLVGISPCDSGSALFSNDGIVGMIIKEQSSYGYALSIDHIKDVITSWNKKYWQLCSKPYNP